MAEEAKTIDERLETRLEHLEARLDRLEQGQGVLRESVARLVGVVEQLSQRIGNLEQNQRWVLGILITSWITLMLTILLKG